MLISFPPSISKLQEQTLKQAIEDWCLSNGLVMLQQAGGHAGVHAPVTLYPSPFSKTGFEEALRLQTTYNQMYQNVTLDPQWLLEQLQPLEEHDEFTHKLASIYRQTAPEATQRLTGGLFRSDYIVAKSEDRRQIKQVEFNTVSVSFGGLSTKVNELHNFLTNRSRQSFHGEIPVSNSLQKLSEGLMHMHKAYVWGDAHERQLKSRQTSPSGEGKGSAGGSAGSAGTTSTTSTIPTGSKTPHLYVTDEQTTIETEDSDPDLQLEETLACVLIVVQPNERNIVDQRLLEFELWGTYNIPSYRVTLSDLADRVAIGDNNRLVHLPTGQEISVVYYRSGYAPTDYPSDREWEARLMLEKSHAIQCPSVLTQLAGAKKVQQVLCEPETLAKFTPDIDSTSRDRLRKTFVKIYPMDESEQGLLGRKLALEQPENFVLKPQREGGGNNVYREDIPNFLASIPKASWGAYILMELIVPQRLTNRIHKDNEIVTGKVVNELGIFGTSLWDIHSGRGLLNEQAGWLLRTKLQSSDEGGIAAGFGALDSVLLVSQKSRSA